MNKKDLINFMNENNISLGDKAHTEAKYINSTKEYGRVATKDIAKDEIIYRIGGMWIDWNIRKEYFELDYFQLVDGMYYFQGGLNPGLFSAVNHSCDPNAYYEDTIVVRAFKHIPKDTEITIDYGALVDHNYIIFEECACESKHCRKQITGKDWLVHSLPIKYDYKISQKIIRLWLEAKRPLKRKNDSDKS